ncbi:MAG TPA: hypothetical protein PKA88_23320, partial [Polyangiaceae bacterium]|nr:hypothetical protein [Polyangiaceae bacterium]
LLGAGAYVFESGASVALSALYAVEGDATVAGRSAPQSSRRWLRGSVAASLPIDDAWSLLGSVFANPPVYSLGVNQTTAVGASFGAKWALL